MDISSDYRDLFRTLNKHKVKYLIVGAYAVVYYTEPRFTKDLDISIKPDPKNAGKIYAALKEFGAPLKDISEHDFTRQGMVYQIGVAPVRIDIIMGITGIRFDMAWKKRTRSKYGNVHINIIGLKDLISSKRKTNRAQDRLDLERLVKVKRL